MVLIVTIGLVHCFKASLCKHSYEGMVHAISIPISILGVISPQTVNNKILQLAVGEIKVPREQSALDLFANHSVDGRLILRVRLPL